MNRKDHPKVTHIDRRPLPMCGDAKSVGGHTGHVICGLPADGHRVHRDPRGRTWR